MTTMLLQRLLAASIETTVAALVVLVISAFALRRAPRLVALLWLVVLAKPLLTLVAGSYVQFHVPSLVPPVGMRADVTKIVIQRGPVIQEQTKSRTRNPENVAGAIWLAGAALLLARTIYHRLRLRSIVRKTREASPRVLLLCERQGMRFPRIRVSDALDGPAIGGALRPVILLPAWMDERADDAQLTWSLRHELRHATARDTLAIALRELALIAFWFHPVTWFAAAKWEGATELACDRDVVTNDVDAVDYADALYRTLLNVRQQRRLQLASGLFATRSKIGQRIAALIERPLAPRVGRAGAAAAFAIGLAVVAIGADCARQPRGHHRGTVEEVTDGRTVNFHYDASLTFDGDRIATIAPGGFVEMRETTGGGTTRSLRLDGIPNGITRAYAINGRAAPPDEAFERTMTAQLRRSVMP